MLRPQTPAGCDTDDVSVVEAEIRNSSRPGSQAPHAPPALTFGLPGKQMVKQGLAGCVLMRFVRGLPRNRNSSTDRGPEICIDNCLYNN
jgi:hypothetical protein